MRTTPKYLHITKAGQRKEPAPVTNGNNGNKEYVRKYGLFAQDHANRPVMRTFEVPICYFVTAKKIIEAENAEEAQYKAQAVEAPPISVEGFSDTELEVETEVNVYDMQEVD